jgi:hypothetical protein
MLVSLGTLSASAYHTTLTDQQVQEAIAYGNRLKAEGRVTETAVLMQGTEWVRELPDDEGQVLWQTAFLNVAWTQARRGSVPQDALRGILYDSRQWARVLAVVRSTEKREARLLRILVKTSDAKMLRPAGQRVADVGLQTGAFQTARYTFTASVSFDYKEGLKPTDKVQLIIGWPDRETSVEFDLSTLR